MLVLSRGFGEALVFFACGQKIRVVVERRTGRATGVKLGIDAPKSVRIVREELLSGDDPEPAEVVTVPRAKLDWLANELRVRSKCLMSTAQIPGVEFLLQDAAKLDRFADDVETMAKGD